MRRTMLSLTAVLALAFAFVPARAQETGRAILAGGCFWCVESDFDKVAGVTGTTSGYIGGSGENPTYEDYAESGFIEAVEIEYDPAAVSYEALLKVFFRSVDPTDADGQFCDRGRAYSTAIFALDEAQAAIAEKARAEAAADLGRRVVTPIEAAARFWPAENYHQDFHEKNPVKYKYYRFRCGRDQKVKRLWGDQAYYGVGS